MKHTTLKRVFNITHNIIVVVLLIILAFSVTARVRSNATGEPAQLFGYTPTIVVSGSMVPTIDVYSISIIKECSTEDVEIGDIIVYRNYDRNISIIHRAIDITEASSGELVITTKGDANPSRDNYKTTNKNIIGKVVYTANWISPLIAGVIQSDGISIDYYKLFGYVMIAFILLWGIISFMGFVLNILIYKLTGINIKAICNEDKSGATTESNNEENSEPLGGDIDAGEDV